MNDKKRGTKTSSFGSAGRENHDSSVFYESKLYEGLPLEKKVKYQENHVPREYVNRILIKSSESMSELPDESVHLMVTSPPYNVGKEYDDNLTLREYLEFLKRTWKEVYRVLVPGGRACINVANLGRKPYIPLHAFIINDMHEIGYLMRGEVIWDKSASAGTSTAWGSWQSASNPTLRDVHEYILIFSKETYSRPKNKGKEGKREDTITKEDFLSLTKSLWSFPAVSARKIGHPAPFPEELPYRCIQLYSFKNEIVLDPFMGSGQTALAALKSRRRFIGYDVSQEYVKLAEKRIMQFRRESKIEKLDTFFD
ncbi:MAG: DNA-methyltransferase [Candidatus Hodarchaeales archaeon]